MHKETIIISLGGSLVAPGEIDVGFLNTFKSCLEKYFNNKQFFVLVGGGKTARNYQRALSEFGAKDSDKDWIGIDATKMNAKVLRQVFGKNAYSEIITNPNIKVKTAKPITIGAGWKPGWSTDYDAVLIAKNHGAKTVINLSNIDYVYDRNPKDFPDAKPLKEVSWINFEKIVGSKWTPGLNMPFDPKASKLAKKLKLKVVIINGKNLERLEEFLNLPTGQAGNKSFIGTTIN